MPPWRAPETGVDHQQAHAGETLPRARANSGDTVALAMTTERGPAAAAPFSPKQHRFGLVGVDDQHYTASTFFANAAGESAAEPPAAQPCRPPRAGMSKACTSNPRAKSDCATPCPWRQADHADAVDILALAPPVIVVSPIVCPAAAASQFAALACRSPVGGAQPAHRVFHVRCGRLARPAASPAAMASTILFVLDLHLARNSARRASLARVTRTAWRICSA